jgi:DNA-binding transcriptional MocR family regulator
VRLYEQLANDLEALIRDGSLAAGARVPSIRQLCRERAASPASVVRAYELLEARGLLQSRERSGFFVSTLASRPAEPASRPAAPGRRPERVDISQLVFQILDSTRLRATLPLGSAFPSPDLFPLRQLGQHLAHIARRVDPWDSVEDLPPGNLALRRQISQRYRLAGAAVSPDEIVITAGALEALNLALQVVTRPNDVVAIETPCFYGCLQAIESAGRRVIEIPTHPQHGLDLAVLEQTLERVPIKACWFMTTFHSPLGTTLAAASKERLVRLLAAHEIPLIEDNVYAELYFGRERPRSTKVWDSQGLVLDCGSFAKSLAPGYRLGWVAAGRYASELWKRKITTSVATSMPIQAAIAHYLSAGVYERHLRKLRRTLARQQGLLLSAIQAHFPDGCVYVRPTGGYQLWIELPPGCDALALHAQALDRGISIAPGPIFSAHAGYPRAIRLNYGHPWTAGSTRAIATLGALAREQLTGRRRQSASR